MQQSKRKADEAQRAARQENLWNALGKNASLDIDTLKMLGEALKLPPLPGLVMISKGLAPLLEAIESNAKGTNVQAFLTLYLQDLRASLRNISLPEAMDTHAVLLRATGRFLHEKNPAKLGKFMQELLNQMELFLQDCGKVWKDAPETRSSLRGLTGELLRTCGRQTRWVEDEWVKRFNKTLVHHTKLLWSDQFTAIRSLAWSQRSSARSYQQLHSRAQGHKSMPIESTQGASLDRDLLFTMPLREALEIFIENFNAILKRKDGIEILDRLLAHAGRFDPFADWEARCQELTSFMRALGPCLSQARKGASSSQWKLLMRTLSQGLEACLDGLRMCTVSTDSKHMKMLAGESLRSFVLAGETQEYSHGDARISPFCGLLEEDQLRKILDLARSHPRKALTYLDLENAAAKRKPEKSVNGQVDPETENEETDDTDDPRYSKEKCTVS